MALRDQSGYLRSDAATGTTLGPLAVDDELPRRQQFDYYQPAGASTYEVRYIGSASQGTLSSASSWTIRRLSHSLFGGEARVTDIQTLTGAWNDRATLPWS